MICRFVMIFAKHVLHERPLFPNQLIADAKAIGYRLLRLESLKFLEAAHSLYRSLGFHEIDPYSENSMEAYQPSEQLDRYYTITVFMEMEL